MGDGETTQLSLSFDGLKISASQKPARLWLMAAEPEFQSKLHDLFLGRPLSSRHIFVNSATGETAFGPSDLVLLREGTDRFLILAPDANEPSGSPMEWMAPAIENLFRCDKLAPLQGQPVQDILLLSFPPGRRCGTRRSFNDDARDARTTLERLICQLQQWPRDSPPLAAMGAYLAAEPALDPNVNAAIRAIFRREYGDALFEMYNRTQLTEYAMEAPKLYLRAQYDFASLHLDAQRRTTRTRDRTIQETILQLKLPGIPLPDHRPSYRLGYNTLRIYGFPIDIPSSYLRVPIAAEHSVRRYLPVGSALVPDATLCDFLSQSPSPRRRLVASVVPGERELTIRPGIQDELCAILGLGAAPPSTEDVRAIRLSSKTLQFRPDAMVLTPGRPAEFFASSTDYRNHTVKLDIVMDNGDNASMSFIIPRDLKEPERYV